MTHNIDVLGCGVVYIDGIRVFGSKPYGLFSTVTWKATDEDLKRIADRCLEVISDCKTENSSEKPNNSTISKMEQVDEPMKTTDYCDICKRDMCELCVANATNPYCVPSHYEINYEPKDEPITQTKTQNSNLTFEKADEPQTDCQWR